MRAGGVACLFQPSLRRTWKRDRLTRGNRPFPWDEARPYLIRDRDSIFGNVVKRRLRAMGIRDKPTAPRSPRQNAFAERLIGSMRRECLDHCIVVGEAHLRRILRCYARYYNDLRTHGRSTRMRLSRVGSRCSGESSHDRCWVGCTTTTHEIQFLAYTPVLAALVTPSIKASFFQRAQGAAAERYRPSPDMGPRPPVRTPLKKNVEPP